MNKKQRKGKGISYEPARKRRLEQVLNWAADYEIFFPGKTLILRVCMAARTKSIKLGSM